MKALNVTLGLTLLLAVATGCDSSINKSVYVQDGERRDGGINTVNGNITIGNDCIIRGDCRTVNGSIRVGQNSLVQGLQVVNGDIEIGQNSKARDDVTTVNGSITLHVGAKAAGDLASINGNLTMDHAIAERDLSLFNGNVMLANASLVKGDIIIKDSKRHSSAQQYITIRLGPGSVVEGDIRVLENEVKVKVYLGKDARVGGEITNAEVIRET
ncbi:MAG TPA: hypothetical protein PLG50_13410 [bacterium]|nr:hypothetical protein [bacterium]HQG46651.1 hypothetical protein [bacterium]HQI47505.1 hypothetical protein [bacterium]HQJ65771.1 hypothetical protein [bacterium]